MRYLITDEPYEKIELVCDVERHSLVQNAKTPFEKVIVENQREYVEIFMAEIKEGILKKLSGRDLIRVYQLVQKEILRDTERVL